MKVFKFLFEIEKKPCKGLLTAEWVILGYLVLTTLLILFTYTKLPAPDTLLWGRFKLVVLSAAMWAVYRMAPCRFTHFCRISVLLLSLSWWYPDTYELNKIFPNLDHYFASWEQQVFGCQPALLFSQAVTNPVFSELIYMGYFSYYPLIGVVPIFYFCFRYQDFSRATFVILAAFFIYYVVFVFLPVTGPQYYYAAAGLDNITKGIFPDVGDYFATHDEALTMAGNSDGFFYKLFAAAHVKGERPTAAFPSSHVGIGTIIMLLAWRARSRALFLSILPLYVLMCLATIYIRAHYVIDIIAGWLSAGLLYYALQTYWTASKKRY